MIKIIIATVMTVISIGTSSAVARERWTAAEASAWYERQPWIVGSNYLPATAVNSLEMWQTQTFDPATIDREFGYAQLMGMNTMRVFLHHLLWEQDPGAFKSRMTKFLDIAGRHRIKVILVLFDSCFDANPKLGPQPTPPKGVYFPAWVQGPGRDRLEDKSKYPLLEKYVYDIVHSFADDKRILMWDIWNEPTPHAGPLFPEEPQGTPKSDLEKRLEEGESKNKAALVELLLPQVFRWAQSAAPSQPLTSAIFDPTHDWTRDRLTPVERVQLDQSDVITFHSYSEPQIFERQAAQLKALERPIICTEFMARPESTIAGILPVGKRLDIGMLNWGFVAGRSQAWIPGDSWLKPYRDKAPSIWNQDLLRVDGTSYDPQEIALIEKLSAAPRGVVPKPE